MALANHVAISVCPRPAGGNFRRPHAFKQEFVVAALCSIDPEAAVLRATQAETGASDEDLLRPVIRQADSSCVDRFVEAALGHAVAIVFIQHLE